MAAGPDGQSPSVPAPCPPWPAPVSEPPPDSVRFFQEACGAADPLRIRICSARLLSPVERLLHQPYAIIRRDQRGSQSPTAGRPRTCAFFQVIAGRIFFIELPEHSNSPGGSEQLHSGWMNEEQPVLIGPFRISAELASQPVSGEDEVPHLPLTTYHSPPTGPWNPLAQESLVCQPLPEVGLEVLSEAGGTRQEEPQRLKRGLVLVGTADLCPVRLIGPTVAPFHCYLLRTPVGLWAVDLREGDGISVNGAPRPWAHLQDGDQLQVGRFSFRVRYEQANAQPLDRELPTDADLPMPVAPSEMTYQVHPGKAVTAQAAAAPQCITSLENFELLSALLMPVVQEFRQMQKQMLEHFDRSMTLMTRMFEVTQQSQQGKLESERLCLQQLEEEVQDLRRKLSARSSPPLKLPPVLPKNGSATSTGRPAAPAAAAEEDSMHLLLHDRIAALKQAPSGRLHKVIQSLLGR